MSSSHDSLVVAIIDAPFEEQLTEVAAYFSRSRPEAERNDFILSFRPKAAATQEEGAAPVETPVDERRALVERLLSDVKDIGEGSEKGEHALAELDRRRFADTLPQQTPRAHTTCSSR